MTRIRHLPASQRPQRRWRNGGGITQDISIFPAESADEDFNWRASLAFVEIPAPFSPWPGIDRILTLASGDMRLTINGLTHGVTAHSAPLAFPGEAAVRGQPLSPCRVFNLMLRRGKALATVRRWSGPESRPMPVIADQLLLFAPCATTISVDRQILTLESGDALWIETPKTAQPIEASGPILAASIRLL